MPLICIEHILCKTDRTKQMLIELSQCGTAIFKIKNLWTWAVVVAQLAEGSIGGSQF